MAQTRPVRRRVLVVEDHAGICSTTTDILELAGYEAVGVASIDEARERLADDEVDLILLDVGADYSGVKLLHGLPDPPPVILMSGYKDRRSDPRGSTFLAKPFSPHQLLDEVERELTPLQRES